MAFALAATVAGFTLVAAPVVAWQAVTRGLAAGVAAVQGFGVPESGPEAEKPAEARTAPSWAQPDKEAA